MPRPGSGAEAGEGDFQRHYLVQTAIDREYRYAAIVSMHGAKLQKRSRDRAELVNRAARISSKLSMMRFDHRRLAATASAIATTSSMKLAIRSGLAMNAAVS